MISLPYHTTHLSRTDPFIPNLKLVDVCTYLFRLSLHVSAPALNTPFPEYARLRVLEE